MRNESENIQEKLKLLEIRETDKKSIDFINEQINFMEKYEKIYEIYIWLINFSDFIQILSVESTKISELYENKHKNNKQLRENSKLMPKIKTSLFIDFLLLKLQICIFFNKFIKKHIQ